MYFSHSNYYIDRRSERDLCSDFPGDEILINGLHAMQVHFHNNRINIDIPVVSVMNAAHYLVAYMMATTCSGDQSEYDVLAYMSVGHDKQMYLLTMVVLAAMLKRTEGFRARNCRNVILDNRTEDFDEGVTLYEKFLTASEERFAEEDFLIDVPALIAQNTQLEYENKQLKYQISKMEEKYTQINIGTQNNNCTQIGSQVINNYYGQPSTTAQPEDSKPESEPAETIESIIFTKKAKLEGKIPSIIEALQKSVQGRKDKTRAFVQELHEWQNDAYVDAHYNARVMYDELVKLMPISFGYEIFKKHYNNTI